MEVGGQRHSPAALDPGRDSVLVLQEAEGLCAGLGGCAKAVPTGIRFPDSQARSESLYRLSYPGPQLIIS